MTTLHLGVVDTPYADGAITTGRVAEILEAKYHVMEVFFEDHKDDIAAMLEQSLSGALENLLMGAPTSQDPLGAASADIEDLFRRFLDTSEIEGLGIPDVPTEAALKGVRRRFKRATVTRDPRPSFVDTGQYQASFKAWIE